jgi:2,3-diphosphopglycerate-independent phosphoglycerate mutase
LREAFPEVELYPLSDFRNTLIFRDASIDPRVLVCPEPHESHQCRFDLERLVGARDATGVPVARRLNEFAKAAAEVLSGEAANALFPWSPSRAFDLPSFESLTGIGGRVAAVGFMDFLIGIAKAGGIEFHRVGNGRPDTDYRAKGQTVVELLEGGCTCVVCHINGPDEASHAGDLDGKIASLERIDRDIVMPILQYFERRPADLGGVIVLPDHYSNIQPRRPGGKRSDVHTAEPVPFALWNNRERDRCSAFNESAVRCGKYGAAEISHLGILPLLLGRGAEVVGA